MVSVKQRALAALRSLRYRAGIIYVRADALQREEAELEQMRVEIRQYIMGHGPDPPPGLDHDWYLWGMERRFEEAQHQHRQRKIAFHEEAMDWTRRTGATIVICGQQP